MSFERRVRRDRQETGRRCARDLNYLILQSTSTIYIVILIAIIIAIGIHRLRAYGFTLDDSTGICLYLVDTVPTVRFIAILIPTKTERSIRTTTRTSSVRVPVTE